MSIGDISCQRLSGEDLGVLDYVQIVENIDDRSHKSNCERAYTLSHQHFNCVLTINMAGKDGKYLCCMRVGDDKNNDVPPIMLSNLDTNILENYGENQLHFTQNSVPFDFDGHRLLYYYDLHSI